MVWNLFQSSFMQGIFNFVPTLRKSIEAPPTPSPELSTTSPVGVEPWKEEVDRWKQLADKTAAERDQLRHEAGQLHVELQRVAQDLDQARAEAEEGMKAQEQELRRQSEELKKKDEEVKQKEETAKRMEEDAKRVEQEAKQKEEELEKAKEALKKAEGSADELQREKATIQALLNTRQDQLEELKLVAGADTVGEDAVMVLLRKLNADISQTAKLTRETFKLDKSTRANGKAASDAASAIEGWVGSALPGLLSTQYRGNAVLLQAALQAMAVAFSSWISSSYSFMHEHDQILDETYKYVMNSGAFPFLLIVRIASDDVYSYSQRAR